MVINEGESVFITTVEFSHEVPKGSLVTSVTVKPLPHVPAGLSDLVYEARKRAGILHDAELERRGTNGLYSHQERVLATTEDSVTTRVTYEIISPPEAVS